MVNQTPPEIQNDDALQSMIKESIHRFLTEYKNGTTDFSNFTSIFTRFLNNLPDPPLEITWFYSALNFHTSKLTPSASSSSSSSLSVAKDLFQLLVSCSSYSPNAVKKIALLAPLIYHLTTTPLIYHLTTTTTTTNNSDSSVTNIKEVESLLEAIVSYVSMCTCGPNVEEYDEFRVLTLSSCFVDLVGVWVIDKIGENCSVIAALRVFFPLVSDGIRRKFDSTEGEGNGIGIGFLAGIVMSQTFLLCLCLKFESFIRVSKPRVEFEKELRDWMLRTFNAFPSFYFFDTILWMLLEPVLPVNSLLNYEEEVILREIMYDAVMMMDFSCFGRQRGIHTPDGFLKYLAITWLFVADNGIRFLRENGGQAKIISHVQAFSESCLPSKLVKWVTNQHGIQNITTPKVSTPLALIRWLLIVEDQGVRAFDCDVSKMYAKTIVCKSKMEHGFFIVKSDGKNLIENLAHGCNENEDNKVDGDLEMVDPEDTLCLTAPGMLKATVTNGVRKRKEESKDDEYKQVKFVKCHLNGNSAREKVSQVDDYNALSSRSEVGSPASDENVVRMEQ